MNSDHNPDLTREPYFFPAGWIGGFCDTHPPQPYPKSELLEQLPLSGNMENIPFITRMLQAKWPEFSWETTSGDPSTRMYQMFAPDISRLGYDDTGRVWAVICPQQGVYISALGITVNVEVTVTGVRGWINETAPDDSIYAADITIEPTIWFSPDNVNGLIWQQLTTLYNAWDKLLPLSKKKGIRITAGGEDGLLYLPVRMGENLHCPFPDRAKHWVDYAWSVSNLAVQIGNVVPSGNGDVDEFNNWVMELFNMGSGNLLLPGNILTWNLWTRWPELVNRKEWENHAEYWRHSIDVNHRPPEGQGSTIADFDGNPYDAGSIDLDAHALEFAAWVEFKVLEAEI